MIHSGRCFNIYEKGDIGSGMVWIRWSGWWVFVFWV